MPPVGKSGPLTKVISSSSPISVRRSQLSITKAMALAISVRLWGGTLVGHTDGDTARAVDEQVGQHGREHGRLFEAVVEVRAPVHRVHVDVGKHGIGDAGEAGLGVTHRGGRVAVDRAKVTLAVDQGVAQAEVLRHARHGIIDGAVAVGVVFTQHLADDTGAFLIRVPGFRPISCMA